MAVAQWLSARRRKHTLHGDAVNVASRMESHGAPGAVQCSAAAAALIEAQGGCSRGGLRLTQREEEVDVKGVGRMRTAWLSHSAAGLPTPGAGPGHASPACCGMSESNPAAPCPMESNPLQSRSRISALAP